MSKEESTQGGANGFFRFIFMENITWTFLFLITQLEFWFYGFPAAVEYGYSDYDGTKINDASSGELVSGPRGSGVVIVTGILMFAVFFSYVRQIINYLTEEEEED